MLGPLPDANVKPRYYLDRYGYRQCGCTECLPKEGPLTRPIFKQDDQGKTYCDCILCRSSRRMPEGSQQQLQLSLVTSIHASLGGIYDAQKAREQATQRKELQPQRDQEPRF